MIWQRCQCCLKHITRRPATSSQRAFSQSHPIRSTPVTEEDQKKTAARLPASSVPEGTILRGLNFLKGKQDAVALPDSEYPDWLWSVLAKSEEQSESKSLGDGDLFAKSKKQRQKAAKALRKQHMLNPEALAPKIPIYEQSVDLPAGDGTVEGAIEAGRTRGGLSNAMRDMRRKKIKEDNFLRAMR